MTEQERVLVVPTQVFHEVGYFQGFSRQPQAQWQRLLAADQLAYRSRAEMESDPSFKQLIPYVVFEYQPPQGETLVFKYRRGTGQGEARLHSKLSIGVGGHISLMDHRGSAFETYFEGMRRELDEEVAIAATYEASLAGMINDDETEVGRVHLGVVHRFRLHAPGVTPREAAMIEAGFESLSWLRNRLNEMESWSQICFQALYPDS